MPCPGHHWRPRGGGRGRRLSKQDFLWTALEHPDVFQRRQKKNSRRALQRLLVKVTAEEKEERKGTVPAAPLLAPPWNEGKLGAGPSPESCRHGNRATPQARPPVTRAGHRPPGRWSQITRWAPPRGSCACEALLRGTARRLFIDPTNSKLGLGLQPRRATVLANSSRKRQ